MRINYNVSAMISNNKLSDNDNFLAQSLERLSSGLKLNHAKDNPAGLAMAKRMNAQIKGLYEANQNASDGVSIIETADGAMTEISEMLQRMNELSIKAATGTVSDNDRAIIQDEIAQLKEEITRISEVTEFNSQKLLNGNFSLKGYTNNIDVKVNTYSEAVASKEYTIKSLQISYCVNEEIDDTDSFDASENSYDKKKGSYRIDSYELGEEFPEGATATIKDDLVIIRADNGFEMQLDISHLNYANGKGSSEEIKVTETIKRDKVTGAEIIGDTDEYDENIEIEEIEKVVGERVWKSVTIPSDVVVPPLSCSNTNHTEEDYHKIESVTIIKNDDDSFSVVPGSLKLGNGFPDNAAYRVDGNQIFITDVDGGEVGITIDDTYFSDGVNRVTFPTDAVSSLVIDATGIGPMRLQVGANEGQVLAIDIPAVNLKNMGIEDIDVSTREGALDAIERIDGAVHYVSSIRGRLGAYQNRLESTINNLDVITENITAAYSRIMDVDMAEEMTKYTTYQVLTQAGTSMLAQANERPSQVLQLLQ